MCERFCSEKYLSALTMQVLTTSCTSMITASAVELLGSGFLKLTEQGSPKSGLKRALTERMRMVLGRAMSATAAA